MRKKIKLVNFDAENIPRGSVFQVIGKYPYEELVDFMIFETLEEETPYGLLVVSGYKSGLILIRLPKECVSLNGGMKKQWVVNNWEKWIYPECDVSDVVLIEKYEIA